MDGTTNGQEYALTAGLDAAAVPELGELGGQAVRKHAEAMAGVIEAERDKIKDFAEDICRRLTNTAAAVREVGGQAADAAAEATVKMQDAAKDTMALAAKFGVDA